MPSSQDKQPDSEIMQFPCEYSLKVFGLNNPGFEQTAIDLISVHCVESTRFQVKKNESKKGKYQSLTITFTAQNRRQMDDIYQSLSDSNDVVMSL